LGLTLQTQPPLDFPTLSSQKFQSQLGRGSLVNRVEKGEFRLMANPSSQPKAGPPRRSQGQIPGGIEGQVHLVRLNNNLNEKDRSGLHHFRLQNAAGL
jgi:hypothetical protein